MNYTLRELQEKEAEGLAKKYSIHLRWEEHAVFACKDGREYSVCYLNDWPTRLKNRMHWMHEQFKESL